MGNISSTNKHLLFKQVFLFHPIPGSVELFLKLVSTGTKFVISFMQLVLFTNYPYIGFVVLVS
jgi:hypothetical protein